jgi:hypothetical protein
MKLYRIGRSPGHDPFEFEKGALRDRAIEETIAVFAEVLVETLSRNKVRGLYISRQRGGSADMSFKSQQSVSIADILELVRLNILDIAYIKLRDKTCRFIDFGQDYYVMLCLRHEDEIETDVWTRRGVEIEDRSWLLTETDIYDF